jgi:hypothetical protein
MGKKLKFPDPKDYPEKTPLIFCPNDRMIGLYNQATGEKRKRMAKKLNEWFIQESKKNGWIGCKTLPEVQSKHGAGCILFNPRLVKIERQTILITHNQDR